MNQRLYPKYSCFIFLINIYEVKQEQAAPSLNTPIFFILMGEQ